MSVYLITHKPFEQPKEQGYKSLLVGAYKGHSFGDVFDDQGDNISEKNANYCELTGVYWIWKNLKDPYVGIMHYRRRLSNKYGDHTVVSEKDILKTLEKFDIILPFKRTLDMSVEEQCCEESCYKSDLDKVREIIKNKYPEYVNSYDEVMNGNTVHFANMMICKKELYDSYCSWLFDILFELEKDTNLEGYNDYMKRIYGFISERLLNVWVRHNQLKVFEMGIVATEETFPFPRSILIRLKRVVKYFTQLHFGK